MSATSGRPPRFRRSTGAPQEDAALTALQRVARRAALCAPAALRRAVICEVEDPVAASFVADAGCERAWRMTTSETPVWCVVDAATHRRLLAVVLGGPPAEQPTDVERSIAGEAVGRMFADATDWREEQRSRPDGDLWRCHLVLRSSGGPSFAIALYARRVAPPARPRVLSDPRDLPVDVSATVAVDRLRFGDVLAARAGEVLVLGPQEHARARLSTGGVAIGAGDVGSDGARRAVRLASTTFGERTGA